MSTRVLVAHSEPLIAVGVAAVLRPDPDIWLVDGEGGTGSDEHRPHVVVCDYETGLLLVREGAPPKRGQPPAQAIVVVTRRESEHDIRHAMEAGIRGYVIQGCAAGEIARAVRAVRRDERHICPRVAERLAQSFARATLTPREFDVLRLMGEGRCNKAIAREMSITLGTAKFRVSCILGKLGARNRTEAVRIAAARGLVNVKLPAARRYDVQ